MFDNIIDDSVKYPSTEESVDDILSDILNSDGTFNENYNNLFAKYMGAEINSGSASAYDISDHTTDGVTGFIPGYESSVVDDSLYYDTEKNIRKKLGANTEAYDNQINAEKRPLYTSNGNVRYPSIGSGASEERVVYDAEWEKSAKFEQEKLQRYYEQNPYKEQVSGCYAAGGVELSRNSYRPVIEQPTSPFVDPISEDDDFDRYWERQYEQNQKKSFFQEGLRSNRLRNDSAVNEDRNNANGKKNNPNNFSSGDWMAVERKKHSGRYKKDRSAIPDRSPLPRTADSPNLNSTGVITSKNKTVQRSYISKSEIEEKALEAETIHLRDTVASIVDKYDKKKHDELIEKANAERIRLENEKRKQAEQALLKAKKAKQRLGISENVCYALDIEEEKPFSQDVYDDFSPNAEEGFEDL